VLALAAIRRARSASNTREAVDPAIPPNPVCGAPRGIGELLAVGDEDDLACELADECEGALSFTRPRAIEPFAGDVEGVVLKWGTDRLGVVIDGTLGVVIDGTLSGGSERPLSGVEAPDPEGETNFGNDTPLNGSDNPVERAELFPEEALGALDVGDVGVVTVGRAMPVPGNVGTVGRAMPVPGKVGVTSSGTPISPSGINGRARGAPPSALVGVPSPVDDDPFVGTVGTDNEGALRRRSSTGSATPEPIDSDGRATPLPLEGVTTLAGVDTAGAAAATAAVTRGRAMALRSRLTAPASEIARPINLAPAPSVIEWSDKTVPTSDVFGARLVAPPTCHSTSLARTPTPRTI
jgi:hypothetical protein